MLPAVPESRMPPLTPGRYIQHRRTAAGLSVADVVAKLRTDPATPERDRVQQLRLIEADARPATFATIIALRAVFAFDLDVLARLEAIAQGWTVATPRLCRICACSELDGCLPARGGPCAWAGPDLCTCCAVPAQGEVIALDAGQAA